MTKRTVPLSPGMHSRSRLILLVGGTVIVLLAGAVLWQFFRSKSGRAAEQPAAAPSSGTSRVATSASDNSARLARIKRGERVAFISQDEVAHECYSILGREVLDRLVNRKIIELACQERGIRVSAAEVQQEAARIARQMNMEPNDWYKFLETQQDLSLVEYHRHRIWPRLALKKLAGEEVTVTEEEIRRGWHRHYGAKVLARMIMLDNLRRANDVWEQATRSPGDFERLAREHSVERNSRPLGGQIPPIARYSGNEQIERAAFKLKAGEISGVIQFGIPARYVILKCEGHTDPVVKEIEEVRPFLYEDIMEQKVRTMIGRVFEQLKRETRVDNYLENTSSGGISETAAGEPDTSSTHPRTRPTAKTRQTAPPGQVSSQ